MAQEKYTTQYNTTQPKATLHLLPVTTLEFPVAIINVLIE